MSVSLVVAYQLTGIALIMTATQELLRLAGLQGAMLSSFSIATGVTHLVGVTVGVGLLVRYGRRELYLGSLKAMLIGLAALAVAYAWPSPAGSSAAQWMPYVRGGLLITVVLAFQLGLAPGFWVITTEIFPDAVRAHGMGFLYSTVFVCGVIATGVKPLVNSRPSVAVFMVICIAFGIYAGRQLDKQLPETRGVAIDDVWKDDVVEHGEPASGVAIAQDEHSNEEVQRLLVPSITSDA